MTFRIALMVTGYVRDRENQENKWIVVNS
jgi:hypothetical protein